MKRKSGLLLLLVMAIICFSHISAQTRYSDYKTIQQRIESLKSIKPSVCSIKTLVRTVGGKDINVITIGTGEKDSKPAIAVIGGIEAPYISGREIALGFAEKLAKESETPEVQSLLSKLTFYIIPDLSPDAFEQYFSEVKFERSVNNRSTDDDRDFMFEEDPFDDLNKDGFITMMRITDPAGTYIESSDDNRLLVQADLSKGEKGIYRLLTEGLDNDKDEKFNEDGPGGVNVNRNFTYNFEEYGQNTGLHAMSEPETKALADFLFDHFNIYMTISFGPQDNLGQPLKASERPAPASGTLMAQGMGRGERQQTGDRRITSIMKSDEVINKLVSDKYHEITGLKGSPVTKTTPGNFMEWAYYHYGRYSFSTPGWWLPSDKGKSIEASFLKYSEKNKIENVFVPWSEFRHPDFPDKKCEIGGIKPFVMYNPHADSLGKIIDSNYKFITSIAGMHPEIELIELKSESAGDGIFRISVKVHNKGIFATCAEVGNSNQWTRIMRITLETSAGQTFLSGQKTQRLQRLEGNGTAEFSWLISGKGAVKISAGAINTGIASSSIELK